MLKVLEIFQSINGEGLSSGHLTTFIRLAGCNLKCPWCDTAYSQNPDAENVMEMTPEAVAGQCTTDYVTITGGEPLLQYEELNKLFPLLDKKHVEIETNGSVNIAMCNPPKPIYYNMDYKLGYAVRDEYRDQALANFEYLRTGDCVKFVVNSVDDMIQVTKILDTYGKSRTWTPLISIVWRDSEKDRKWLMQSVIDYMKINKQTYYDARFQLQMHKYIWEPNKRCV